MSPPPIRNNVFSVLRRHPSGSFTEAGMIANATEDRQQGGLPTTNRTPGAIQTVISNMQEAGLLEKRPGMPTYKPKERLIDAARVAQRELPEDSPSRKVGTIFTKLLGRVPIQTRKTLRDKLDQAREENIVLRQENEELREGHVPADLPDTTLVGQELDDIPEEMQTVTRPSTPVHVYTNENIQPAGVPISRMPTMQVYYKPVTPVRTRNNGTQFLPTPPTTDAPSRALSRGGSFFRSAPVMEREGNIGPSSSPTPMGRQSSVRGPKAFTANPISAIRQQLDVLEAEREGQAAREQDLSKRYNELQEQLSQSEQQRAECEREIQAFRDQGRKRTQAYEDLQRREAELCAQRDELRHKMEEIVEATAGIMTLANRRIAEQAEEIVQVRQTNYQLRSVITALPGLAWQLTNGLVQKLGVW